MGVEDEMNDTTVLALNKSGLLPVLLLGDHAGLDALLVFSKDLELVTHHSVQKHASVLGLLGVGQDGAEQCILVSNGKLVLEAVAPVRALSELLHGAHVASGEELLGDVEALQLVHGLDLLLTLGARVVQSLVLLFDEGDLALDLLIPLSVSVLLPLLVLLLEFADLLQLSFFFNLKDGLLGRFRQEHVEDGLDLSVEIEKVVVADLSDFVDASLLGHVLGGRRFRQEHISLRLHIVLFRCGATLLSEEVGEVDLNSCGRSRTQIIWLSLALALLEFEQLLFYHFDLLFLPLHLYALLFLLSRRQIGLQEVRVVSVTSEDALVVHDVEGLAAIFLIIVRLVRAVHI